MRQAPRERFFAVRANALSVLAASLIVLSLTATSCGSADLTGENQENTKIATVQDIPARLLVAHRGSPLKYPEESLEAFQATADAGFPLEMDIRPLKDGTLVPSHDRSVDRTMTGATGKLKNLTIDQWETLGIRGVGDGPPGSPTTWDELLNTFGGKILMVPQIDESGELLDGFIKAIKERQIIDSIVVQSWSLETSAKVSSAGLHALQLVSESRMIDPATIAASGVKYVGAHTSVPTEYVQELNHYGINVWVYTVNTVKEADVQYTKGAVGIFTDDPWLLSGASQK